VLWFCDGETAAFRLPIQGEDLDRLEAYLQGQGIEDYRLLICDEQLTERLRVLTGARRCPECRGTDLKYLAADSERLEEDQLLCRGCGGMFTLTAVQAVAPVQYTGLGKLNIIAGVGQMVFATSMDGGIFRSRDGGAFEQVKRVQGQLFGLRMLSEQLIIATGQPGRIVRSTNGGKSWSSVKGGGKHYLFNVVRTPGGTLLVAGTGEILRSTDEGKSWSATKVPAPLYLLHIDVVDDELLFAVGHQGVILRSDDGGGKWRRLDSGVTSPLCRIRAFDRQELVVIGDRGVVLTSSDGGEHWTRRPVKAGGDIEDMTIGNDGRLYAVTGSGQILISANRGKTWSGEPSGTTNHLWAIWASPQGVLWMAGDDGVVVRRDDLDTPLNQEQVAQAAALATVGKSFVFTGKLKRLTRAQAQKQVELLGGVNGSSVTRDLDYLVVGDEGSPLFGAGDRGSKLLAAEKLIARGAALQIISETVFSQLERQGGQASQAPAKKKAPAKKTPARKTRARKTPARKTPARKTPTRKKR